MALDTTLRGLEQRSAEETLSSIQLDVFSVQKLRMVMSEGKLREENRYKGQGEKRSVEKSRKMWKEKNQSRHLKF